MRLTPILHGRAWSSVGDRGLCSLNPRARTAQGQPVAGTQDRLGSQKGLPRRNNVRPASGGVVVDGKGVRVFLLEKEQTTEGMLSKGIIYLEMRELGAPGAQGVYVEAVQVRL